MPVDRRWLDWSQAESLAAQGHTSKEIAQITGRSLRLVCSWAQRTKTSIKKCPRHLRGFGGNEIALAASIQRTYGCSYERLIEINRGARVQDPTAPAYLYRQQRQRAVARGIEWDMSLPEWVETWGDRLPLRGRGPQDLCMARHGDVGPYAVANVYITTNRQNQLDRPKAVHKKATDAARTARMASARGWAIAPRCPVKPYRVYCQKKYVGHYATQAEAEAAYRAACAAALALINPVD